MIKFFLYEFFVLFNKSIVVYVVIISVVNAFQMFLSLVHSYNYSRKATLKNVNKYSGSFNIMPISILVPAYNEQETIEENIRSLLSLNYSTFEVLVINDGSTDETLQRVIEKYNLKKITFPIRSIIKTNEVRGVYFNSEYPALYLIDKENGGKGDALNVGINASRYPYFVSIDADSLLDSDSLIRVALSMMEYKYTIAIGGIVRIMNGSRVENGKVVSLGLPKSSVARFQIVEYFRAFLVGRVGWSIFNSLLIISGAFGAFHKESVISVGGYSSDTIGEDMDLVMKLHKYMREKKYKYKISFLPDPICWTQAPENLKDLYGQRRRWQIGLIDSMRNGREMFLNPKYGVLGMLALPYYFFFEQMGPIVEGLGILLIPVAYYFGIISFTYFLLFFVATTLFGMVLSVGAFAIEEYTFNKYVRIKDFFILIFYSFIENFGYRQMTVLFRLVGALRYKKYKNAWGKIKRQNFETGGAE